MLETIKTKDYVPDSAWSLNKMDCKPFTPTYILNIVLSHLTPLFDLNFLSEILINFARFQVFELQVNPFPIWWLDKKSRLFNLWIDGGRKWQDFLSERRLIGHFKVSNGVINA